MEKEFLLYDLRPTAGQVRTTLSVALLVLIAFLATLPFQHHQLARVDAFIPVFDTALLLGDWIIATLLFAQASVLRSKALMALGAGYFFTGLIIIPHGLTFPRAFSPAGLLGAGLNTTNWLYFFWHGGLPVAVIAYALLKNARDWSHTAFLTPHRAIAAYLICATALAVALTLLATAGEPLLPHMMSDPRKWHAGQIIYVTGPLMLLIAAAMVMTWRGHRSALDLWLLLVLWAWFLELFLTTLTWSRFSVGWYAGRMIGLLSGLFVLLMLLAETNRLYARTVLQVTARLWERENRLMIRDAIAASIAHELRQPLAAIMLNAQAGRRRNPEQDGFMSTVLSEVVNDCHRANDIIESTRAIFGKSASQKTSSNINQLVRDTLAMISRDLRDLDVSVELRLDPLPPIDVNRLQIQQAFLNLFMNAAEAMSAVADGPRMLMIRSGSGENGLIIGVEDTGPGIATADQERIFDAFFTTKKHGTGLGLSICRSVIDAHGGRLRTVPRAPVGAVFEIYLPYCGSAETSA
jgi:signal transduction histidine kinase